MATTKASARKMAGRKTEPAAGPLMYIDTKGEGLRLADTAADGYGRLERIELTVAGVRLDESYAHVRELDTGAAVLVNGWGVIIRPDGDDGRQVALSWAVLQRLTGADWQRIGLTQTHDQ